MSSNNLITFPNDPETTKSVSVAGSFSEWEPLPMTFNEKINEWEFDLYDYLISLKSRDEIIGNSYMYKFILNGDNWCCNILKPIVKDASGNDNNEFTITASNVEITGENITQLDSNLTLSSSSTRSASPNEQTSPQNDSKIAEDELSPLSSIHSIENTNLNKVKDPQDDEGNSDVESIDDVAVAEQVSGFLGFLSWLWELILLRVFGRELNNTNSNTAVK